MIALMDVSFLYIVPREYMFYDSEVPATVTPCHLAYHLLLVIYSGHMGKSMPVYNVD